jgi:hypothetical protein
LRGVLEDSAISDHVISEGRPGGEGIVAAIEPLTGAAVERTTSQIGGDLGDEAAGR